MRSTTCLPSLEQHRAACSAQGGSLQRTRRQPAAHRAAACSALHDPTLSPTAYPDQVLSTNLQGGEAYALSPRLHEYCVALVAALARQARLRVGQAEG